MLRIGFALLILLALSWSSGCTTERPQHVRVTEAWHQPLRAPIIYRVQPGDSLYSIAWSYGLDYRQIAQDNHVAVTYHVRTGKKLRLSPHSAAYKPLSIVPSVLPASAPIVKALPITALLEHSMLTAMRSPPVKQLNSPINPQASSTPTDSRPANTTVNQVAATPAASPLPVSRVTALKSNALTWRWPACGKVIDSKTGASLNKGVDISGALGDAVTAAADGKIVYAGNGLRGYGLLIIIKHNEDFLSAYAHCQKILVKENQPVVAGQKIALLGASEAKSPLLHFEIRLNGKPVDPSQYLPAR